MTLSDHPATRLFGVLENWVQHEHRFSVLRYIRRPQLAPNRTILVGMRHECDESRFSVFRATRNSFLGSTRTPFGPRSQSVGQQTRIVRTLFELARNVQQQYRLHLRFVTKSRLHVEYIGMIWMMTWGSVVRIWRMTWTQE